MTEKSGRTTKQMLEAPKDAYFVWQTKAFAYPRALARHLKRDDLTIVNPGFFGYRARNGKRLLKVPIIVDHACVLTVSEAANIMKCNTLEEKF